MNLDVSLKTVLENPSTSPEGYRYRHPSRQEPRDLHKGAETVFERTTGSGKPLITDEIIQLCKDKRAVANRQYPENRDTYKYFKWLMEKKIKCFLTAYIHNKCDKCKLGLSKRQYPCCVKKIRELSRGRTTNVLLDKDGTLINVATGIRERWKQQFHAKLIPPMIPNPTFLEI